MTSMSKLVKRYTQDNSRTYVRGKEFSKQEGRGGAHERQEKQRDRHDTATKKGTCSDAGALISYWRPQGDLNPCRRRERPLSWAG